MWRRVRANAPEMKTRTSERARRGSDLKFFFQMAELLHSTSGRVVTKRLELLNSAGKPLVGYDRQVAEVTLKLRPFKRFTRTESFRVFRTPSEISKSPTPDGKEEANRQGPSAEQKLPEKSVRRTARLSAHLTSVLEEVLAASRFVHAQIWLVDSDNDLVFRGEHCTKASFSDAAATRGTKNADKQLQDLLSLSEAARGQVGDTSTLEGRAAAASEEEGHLLEDFVGNPEIIVSDRLQMAAKLFHSCLAFPIRGVGSKETLAVLLLFAAHEPIPMIVNVYCRRTANEKLFLLLDQAATLLSCAITWDRTLPQYHQSLAVLNYNIRERVRKLWARLRIVVLCGWIRTAAGQKSTTPAQLTLQARFWAYVNKCKGAGAKPPPSADMTFAVWTFLGVFSSILVLAAINEYGFGPNKDVEYAILIGPFGALATLLFAAPASPFAQPKMVLFGHIYSGIVAVSVDYLVNTKFATAFIPPMVGAALVPALAIAGMTLLGCINPPAAAASLVYATGNARVKSAGWLFIPVHLAGCAIMVLIAILLNNLSAKRRYPQFWY